MATGMTYTSLLVDIRRYIERGEPNDPTVYDQLPRLVNLAERNLARELKVTGMINVVTSELIAGTSVYAKPNRWRETVSMSYGSGGEILENNVRKPIFPRSYEYCRSYWPDSNQHAVPEFYADYNYNFWLIVPTPVATVPWEIIYYQLLPLLGPENQTNWLTDFAPEALLYRCLLECWIFLKADSQIQSTQMMLNQAMGGINREDLSKIIDRTTTRQED